LFDQLRGVQNVLQGNTTAAETSDGAGLTAFGANDFTLGSTINQNENNSTFIAWNWNAGGTTVTNNAGSVTSQVRANPTAGFSIVTYTSAASAVTVGHGLGTAPNLIIVKARGTTSDWFTYHSALGATQGIYLNQTLAAVTSANFWNNVAPTSTVFTNGVGVVNGGNTAVAYCWAEVPGYSRFGSYTGNGAADGTFVYCGFRPAYVLIKAYSGTSAATANWLILDSARSTYNVADAKLAANLSDAENTSASVGGTGVNSIDFLSNGFKLKTTYASSNESGTLYIFAAFAESPFKYSRAR
jgi:hypothetical protein